MTMPIELARVTVDDWLDLVPWYGWHQHGLAWRIRVTRSFWYPWGTGSSVYPGSSTLFRVGPSSVGRLRESRDR
jgi:hypothetical protein